MSIKFGSRLIVSSLAVMFFLAGCERGAEQVAEPEKSPEALPAVTGSEELPPGHPPLDEKPAAPAIPAGSTMPSNHPAIDDVSDQADAEASGQEEDEYAHPELSGAEIEIKVSDEVAAGWSAVLLSVSELGAARELRAPLGENIALEQTGMVLRADAFLPSYTSDFNTITSASNTLDNPAVMVWLTKGDEVVARGWVFQNLPEYNTFKSDSVDVQLLSAESIETGTSQ